MNMERALTCHERCPGLSAAAENCCNPGTFLPSPSLVVAYLQLELLDGSIRTTACALSFPKTIPVRCALPAFDSQHLRDARDLHQQLYALLALIGAEGGPLAESVSR